MTIAVLATFRNNNIKNENMNSLNAERVSNREKAIFFNTLSILLKAIEGQKTTIDLRNESSVFGFLESTDAYMNVVMKNCIFTDPRGDSFNFETFFVTARNIRCVQIPPQIQIIPAIEDQLKTMKRDPKNFPKRATLKGTRARKNQEQTQEMVSQMLEDRKKKEKKRVDQPV